MREDFFEGFKGGVFIYLDFISSYSLAFDILIFILGELSFTGSGVFT